MNITRALTLTGRIVSKRATILMLTGVRVTVTDGVAALQATDIDQHLTIYCEAPGAADLAPTIVEHKTLAALVKAAPGADISTLVRGMAPICDASDWLSEPEYTVEGTITMPAPTWCNTLASVGSCMSGEETRYYLRGIHFGQHGHAVSTDGHRMAALKLPDGTLDLAQDIIVPHHAVAMLASILSKDSNTRTLTVNATPRNGTWTRLVTPTVHYAARVVDGTFPDWQRIVPSKAPKHTLTLRLATLAGHGADMARLVPRRAHDVAGKALVETTSVSITVATGANTNLSLPVMDATSSWWEPVAFQPKYLADLAAAFPKGATITLAMVDTTGPALITSQDAPDMRYVLMPVRYN